MAFYFLTSSPSEQGIYFLSVTSKECRLKCFRLVRIMWTSVPTTVSMDGGSRFLYKLLKSHLHPFSSAQVKKAASKRHFCLITGVRVAVTLLE